MTNRNTYNGYVYLSWTEVTQRKSNWLIIKQKSNSSQVDFIKQIVVGKKICYKELKHFCLK